MDERSLTQTTAEFAPPPRWPLFLALVLGALCLMGALVATLRVHEAASRTAAVQATLDKATQLNADLGTRKALLLAVKQERNLTLLWERRRTGIVLASAVLFLGAFFGFGIRKIYDRVQWAVREDSQSNDGNSAN